MGLDTLFNNTKIKKVVNKNEIPVEEQGNIIQTNTGNAIPLFQKQLPMKAVTLTVNQFKLPKFYLVTRDKGLSEIDTADEYGNKTDRREFYRLFVANGDEVVKQMKSGLDVSTLIDAAIRLDIMSAKVPSLDAGTSLIKLIKPQVMLDWKSQGSSGSYSAPRLVCEKIEIASDDEVSALVK